MAPVGACFDDPGLGPVPCDDAHVAQTVFVSRNVPSSNRAAVPPCRRAQADFLGQDFNTKLDLQLWLSSDRSWYRCDVFLPKSTLAGHGYQALTGSLRGVLQRGVSIELQACLDEPYNPHRDQVYVSCRKPHVSYELIVAPALATMSEAYPHDIGKRAVNACNAAALASSLLTKGRTVTAYYPKNPLEWSTGERTATCWLTATRGKLPPVVPNR